MKLGDILGLTRNEKQEITIDGMGVKAWMNYQQKLKKQEGDEKAPARGFKAPTNWQSEENI